jgi:hypothetical protein
MLQLSWDMLRDAIAIYLKHAYPSGQLPEVVQKRVPLDSNRPMAELLAAAPFENYVADAPFQCTVHALRLGSVDYPHLKMEIRPFPNRAGFMFWVNTHDQYISPDAKMPDAERWREVVRRNRDLKQAVERAWAEAKLPTYAIAMREDLDEKP